MSRIDRLTDQINRIQAKIAAGTLPQRRIEDLQEELADLRDERYALKVKEKIDALEARVTALEG